MQKNWINYMNMSDNFNSNMNNNLVKRRNKFKLKLKIEKKSMSKICEKYWIKEFKRFVSNMNNKSIRKINQIWQSKDRKYKQNINRKVWNIMNIFINLTKFSSNSDKNKEMFSKFIKQKMRQRD